MADLFIAFIVILLAWFLFSFFRMRFEGKHPVFYKDVSLDGLNEHIFEMYQRGHKKCQLHIEEQNTGKKIVFRKDFKNCTHNIDFDLVIENIFKGHKYPRNFLKNIRNHGVRCVYGVRKIPEIPSNSLVCRFGPKPNLDVIYLVARMVLGKGYGLPENSLFNIHIEGKISWASTEYQIYGWTMPIFHSGKWRQLTSGRPYKKWQQQNYSSVSSMFYWLGLIIGSITKLLFGWPREK